MASVDPIIAQWLQSDTLWTLAEDAALAARWGTTALSADRKTTLSDSNDAVAEGARVLAFRGQPLAIDTAELPGAFVEAIGTVITIEHNELGYDAGVDVFVIAAEDDHATRLSQVTVLRRL